MLLALGARVEIRSPRGDRTVDLADFITGVFSTDLAEDEVVTGVEVPLPRPGTGAAYEKFEQPASHLALCGVAVVLSVENARIREARVAMTGVASTPQRLRSVEDVLVGASTRGAVLDEAAHAAVRGVEPLEDMHAPAAYRLQLLKTATRQALAVATSRTGEGWRA
jgi:carbon-monoxide dehydrogenase medium subunit